MRIQHNIAALNANRMLDANNNKVSKNLEKLSSGYKINRAGDDAAGLAISEKMRGQIRGLDQATNNANDGISLVQTAEGALNETASILQRMKELATQSSNGTYQTAVDRDNIQKEVTSLSSEIDRISTSTNFNKISLLNGSIGGYDTTAGTAVADIKSVSVTGGKLASVADAFKVTVGTDGASTIDTLKYNKNVAGVPTSTAGTASAVSFETSVSGDVTIFTAKVDKSLATAEEAEQWSGVQITVTRNHDADGTYTGGNSLYSTGAAKGLVLQIGDSTASDQQVTLNVGDMSSAGLGLTGISVASQEAALAAIDTISTAINTVSSTRADLGAMQNRLEHTVSNLGVTSENLTSAESRIRDVDMAKEMMEMTKNNVLAQAAQSMLAQANTQPQNVLKLLQ